MIKEIELSARRWTDSFGNTYFSCQIFIDDKLFHTEPFHYGYEYSYEHFSSKYIRDNYLNGTAPDFKLPKEFLTSPSRYCRENGIKWVSRVTDVKRKRDLHK